jgi:hypothetical protein
MGDGKPFAIEEIGSFEKIAVGTQTDLQYSLPIYPILTISASVLILVYQYAK